MIILAVSLSGIIRNSLTEQPVPQSLIKVYKIFFFFFQNNRFIKSICLKWCRMSMNIYPYFLFGLQGLSILALTVVESL